MCSRLTEVHPVQVYKPYECDLRPWNPEQFADCTAAKRIIMIGDSLMRQQWLSLACLLNDVTVSYDLPTPYLQRVEVNLRDASSPLIKGYYSHLCVYARAGLQRARMRHLYAPRLQLHASLLK